MHLQIFSFKYSNVQLRAMGRSHHGSHRLSSSDPANEHGGMSRDPRESRRSPASTDPWDWAGQLGGGGREEHREGRRSPAL